MTVDLQALATFLASACVAIGGIVTMARWLASKFDKLIEAKIAQPVNHASAQLRTSNGHTVAQYIEDLTDQVNTICADINVLTQWAGENRQTAKRAEEKADRALGAVETTNQLLAGVLAVGSKE